MMPSFFQELKRRNVFRVGAAYLITAWLLAQVADLALESFGAPEWVMKSILLVLLIGFPLALVLAWAFELTPEGIKRDSEADASRSNPSLGRQQLNRVLAVLLVAAVGFIAIDRWLLDTSPGQSPVADATQRLDKSIAVLPFENRSSLAEDSHFVDGIQDDILTQLSKLSGLDKVISRTSVERYRDTRESIPDIGKALGVAAILEGGVQRSGKTVRITVQLIEAATDKHLWSETFDRELTAENLFAVQSQISTEIARLLQVVMTADDQSQINRIPTSNLEAYNHFVAGREALRERTAKTIRAGLAHFRKAVELDPDYAQGHAGIAEALLLSTEYGNVPRESVIDEIKEELRRAKQLDPALGEAYAVNGSLLKDLDEYEEAEAEFRKAMELSPNYSRSYHWFSLMLRDQGRYEEALELIKKARALDPEDPTISVVEGTLYAFTNDPDTARSIYLQGIAKRPDFPELYSVLGFLVASRGEFGLSARLMAQANSLNPERSLYVYGLCRATYALTDADLRNDCQFGDLELDPGRGINFMLFRGDYQGAIDLARTVDYSSDSTMFWDTYIPLLLLMADWQEARQLLEKNVPALFQSGEASPESPEDLWKLLEVATVLRDKNGWTDLAREKAGQVLQNISLAEASEKALVSLWAHGVRGELAGEIAATKLDIGRMGGSDFLLCVSWDSPLFQRYFDLGPDAEAFAAGCRAPEEQRQWYRENRDKPFDLNDYR
jgi:TolB-like protein